LLDELRELHECVCVGAQRAGVFLQNFVELTIGLALGAQARRERGRFITS
jgi:hypothetical protein